MNDDGARLRLHALEKRMAYVEHDVKAGKVWLLIFAGMFIAGVVVCAFELRHIVTLMEGLCGMRS